MTILSAHINATDITNATFHCGHPNQSASYAIPTSPGSDAYITGTPQELLAAAEHLTHLAHQRRKQNEQQRQR